MKKCWFYNVGEIKWGLSILYWLFAIFEKYQGNNYGTMALEYLIKNIIKDTPLCLEIEKETEKDINTIRRAKFYRNLGFKKLIPNICFLA